MGIVSSLCTQRTNKIDSSKYQIFKFAGQTFPPTAVPHKFSFIVLNVVVDIERHLYLHLLHLLVPCQPLHLDLHRLLLRDLLVAPPGQHWSLPCGDGYDAGVALVAGESAGLGVEASTAGSKQTPLGRRQAHAGRLLEILQCGDFGGRF